MNTADYVLEQIIHSIFQYPGQETVIINIHGFFSDVRYFLQKVPHAASKFVVKTYQKCFF